MNNFNNISKKNLSFIFRGMSKVKLASITAILGLLLSYIYYKNPILEDDLLDADLLGIWFFDYSYNVPGGIYKSKGTIEHLPNGDYNYSGLMIFELNYKEDPFYMEHAVSQSGEWYSKGDMLIYKIIDTTTHPVKTRINNTDVGEFLPDWKDTAPNFGEIMTKGASQKYTILDKEKSTILVEFTNPNGVNQQLTMEKKDRHFLTLDSIIDISSR